MTVPPSLAREDLPAIGTPGHLGRARRSFRPGCGRGRGRLPSRRPSTFQIRTLLSSELTASREPSGLKAIASRRPGARGRRELEDLLPRAGVPQPMRWPRRRRFPPATCRPGCTPGRSTPVRSRTAAAPRPSRRPRRGPRPRTRGGIGTGGLRQGREAGSVGAERHGVLQVHDLPARQRDREDVPCRRRGPRSSGRSPPCPPAGGSTTANRPPEWSKAAAPGTPPRSASVHTLATGLPVEDLDPPVRPARPVADARREERNACRRG